MLLLAVGCASMVSGQYVAPRVAPEASSSFAAPESPAALRTPALPIIVNGNTVTVTQSVTVDSFVTQTDTVYNSVPVTLTNVIVRTETLQTAAVSFDLLRDRCLCTCLIPMCNCSTFLRIFALPWTTRCWC